MNKKHKELVFSGVQPTGNLHLGNYLGAMKNFVDLQKKMSCVYCVVDLHAITVFKDPKELRENILETTAGFLACGLDFHKSIIFNQSSVSGHSQLAWILNCVSRVGWMNRMTQFKEKAGSNRENASVGLYVYPNLMAADILLYKATHVPVGDDQKQHLELARDIAQKFNNDFKSNNFFPLPEALIQKKLSRVMSLRDGKKKMSKSEDSDYSRIDLKDTEDEIKKKIKKAKTDSLPIPEKILDLNDRPEALNLLNIYSFLTNSTLENTLNLMQGKDFSKFKKELSDVIISTVCPIGKKINSLKKDKAYLVKILEEGTNKANLIAENNLKEVKKIIGFV
jgi:tryptophanyl-tRNA synthetase